MSVYDKFRNIECHKMKFHHKFPLNVECSHKFHTNCIKQIKKSRSQK